MVMMDSISRMVPGVLSNQESGETESFAENLLEYPQYSRRKNGMDRKFHQFFSPDITQILKHGDGNSPFCVQQSVARIF